MSEVTDGDDGAAPADDEDARDSLAGDISEFLDPDREEFDEESPDTGVDPDAR